MNITKPNSNIFKQNPEVADALNLLRKDIFLNLNCHAIGTVQAFDAAKQTAQVTINYTRTFYEEAADGNFVPVYVNYPVLADCPVLVLGGGGACVTMPVKKGDQCLILFNDRSIDDWYASGQKTDLSISRFHSLSDGIVFVGLQSKLNPIDNYDQNRAVLRYGKAAVGVRDDTDKVLLTNDYPTNGVTLRTLLQDLITAIKAITVSGVTTGGGTSGTPVNSAVFTSIATQIGNLLE